MAPSHSPIYKLPPYATPSRRWPPRAGRRGSDIRANAFNVVDAIRDFARTHPDHPAFVVGNDGETGEISYGSLIAAVDELCRTLRAAGVSEGQRVGVTAPQTARFVETALAVMSLGACLVPIPADAGRAALDTLCERAYLHRLVTTADLSSLAPSVRELGTAAALDAAVEREFAAVSPAYLRFTSGTTDTRKGVVIGHRRIAERLAAANATLAIGPADRVLWLLPMAHHFVVSILLYLRAGATIALPASSLASSLLRFAAAAGATVLYASPYQLGLLAGDGSPHALGGLRLAVSTTEQLRAQTARTFAHRFGLPVVQALGIIEVGLPVINHVSAAAKPEALGRPLPDYDVWLRDEDGSRLEASSPQRTGEICIRGPGLFDAYLDPWTPSSSMPDGLRTGDQGWFDDDGDLHLVGRRRNRINVAGMKFFCEEVERVLDSHPAVRHSLVYAREHPHLGEIPAADVVLQARTAEMEDIAKELSRYCRDRLQSYMVPRSFRVVDELALTPTGKVARAETDPA